MLGGVLVLGAGNLLVKVIGLVFKIPLSRLLGDLGMGYFNTGYTVYSWLFLVGCTGFPVAVSMLVSEAVELEDGTQVGVVTTGYHSISLEKSICFALVKRECGALDTPLYVRIRKKVFPGKVVKKRFYQTNYKK